MFTILIEVYYHANISQTQTTADAAGIYIS